MKQILQNMSNGETRLVEVPVPQYGKTDVLIQSSCSLVSIGTERMLVEFGRAFSRGRGAYLCLKQIIGSGEPGCPNVS